MRLLYKPFAVIIGLIGGIIGRKTFDFVWTKIDDQVMIAHNCRIGRHNIICSQVGVAGSTTTGDYVVMAGQVGVRDHVHIGDGATLETVLELQLGEARPLAGSEDFAYLLAGFPLLLLSLLALAYLSSAFTIIGPGEVGWVQRFGRVVESLDGPGLYAHLPAPFDRVTRLRHQEIREVEFVWEIPKGASGEILRRELIERERSRSEATE